VSEHVEVSRVGDVLRIVMTRTAKKNALTGAMYDAMRDAIQNADAGAIVIEGADGVFTAGNDIADFLKYSGDFAQSPALRFVQAIASCETPLIAAIDGAAVGVGTTMLLHCDLAYATPGAKFRMPFIDLGVVPEAAATLLLPRRVGMARASELLLLCEPFDSEKAREMGLINAIVAPEDLSEIAMEKACLLAAKPRNAVRNTRKLLRGDATEINERIALEARMFADALRSPEALAAMTAFLSRGKP
jgi:enoyl-CoA hydratase/carnithine racemase